MLLPFNRIVHIELKVKAGESIHTPLSSNRGSLTAMQSLYMGLFRRWSLG